MEKDSKDNKFPEERINFPKAIQEALKDADISPKSSFHPYTLQAIEKIHSDMKKNEATES
jgi:hypothetical protein